MRHLAKLCSLLILPSLFSSPARAELLFHGDFETGDLKQWGYLLNEAGLSVVSNPVVDGTHAGKVVITKDDLWSNGLNRVEVQYKPPAERVADGSEVFYGYSFNLPEPLSADNHQILYWETDSSYQQVMHVAIEGQKIYFATQKPSFTKHWEAEGAATPGTWHRLVQRVKWSADASVGEVDLWFDGKKVVDAVNAQTYLGDPAFVQHGILRQPTSNQVETLYMDDARFGTTFEDVQGAAVSAGGAGTSSGGAGGNGTYAGASGGGAGGSEAPATSGASAGGHDNAAGNPGSVGTDNGGDAGTASGATGGAAPPSTDKSSCAVGHWGAQSRGTAALLPVLGIWLMRRRRR